MQERKGEGAAEAAKPAVSPTLRIVEHYAVPIGEAELQLRSAKRSMSLRGGAVQKVLPNLLPLLDGTLNEAEIVARLDGKVESARVRSVLKALIEKELVEQLLPPPSFEPAIDWSHNGTVQRYFGSQTGSRYEVLGAIRQARVLLVGGGIGTAALVSALGHLGLAHLTVVDDSKVSARDIEQNPICTPDDEGRPSAQVLKERLAFDDPEIRVECDSVMPGSVQEWRSRLEGATFAVIAASGPALFQPWLEAVNEAALELRLPWTTVAWLDERIFQIGPTVVPEVTACHHCFVEQFQRGVAFLEGYRPFEQMMREGDQSTSAGTPLAQWPAELLAIEVVRAISRGPEAATYGKLLSLDLSKLEITFHAVAKLPRCTACGPTRDSPRMRIWS